MAAPNVPLVSTILAPTPVQIWLFVSHVTSQISGVTLICRKNNALNHPTMPTRIFLLTCLFCGLILLTLWCRQHVAPEAFPEDAEDGLILSLTCSTVHALEVISIHSEAKLKSPFELHHTFKHDLFFNVCVCFF